MRAVIITKTGTGSSTTAPTNLNTSPTGTVTYSIQHTFDDVYDANVTPVWFNHTSLVTQTVSADGNYAFPVRGIKVLVTAGAGTATATLLQAGIGG